jgi:hypothetical protein
VTIEIRINVEDATPGAGCNIAYQAFPSEGMTMEEVSTSNVVIAFCNLLSDPSFIDLISYRIEKEIKSMHIEQDAALAGSDQVM